MRRPHAARLLPCLLVLLLAACTGLTAGPEVNAVTPVPASRDSAWVRAKRALTTEVFTLDVQDSLSGHIKAMRYPSATAKVGTAAACRVQLAMDVNGGADTATVATTSRWIAPEVMAGSKCDICEQDRRETMDRILVVVAPAPTPQ
jgi:hypothetical protein